MTGNPDSGGVLADPNVSSAKKTPEQTLMEALQDFILPLIRIVDPKAKDATMDQRPLELEAKKLITALQEFVSNIVQSARSISPKSIEVRMVEESDALPQNGADEGGVGEVESDVLPSMGGNEDDTVPEHHPFHDKVLKALREHVFNAMPIRLLRFEPHGSDLQIALVERGAIHAHLEATLLANIHKKGHLPIRSRSGSKETTDQAIKRVISKYAKYAILSHTWLRSSSGEVTFADWNKGSFDVESQGYQKLVRFCKTAWNKHGVTFGWMDTVCINKESSSELDESIRSMYNWYARSDVCMVYLAETETLSDLHVDAWFTRGWTLQELLAPPVVKFYDRDWQKLVEGSENDKVEPQITDTIQGATSITTNELLEIHSTSISRRMQLAASRQVTREEDIAYSLMGIFDVSITTAYGEGAKRAYSRLLQEIISTSFNVLDIFNGAGKIAKDRAHPSGVLPSHPQFYINRSIDANLSLGMPIEPLTLTHLGLRVPVLLMPALSASATRPYIPIGDFKAVVNISPLKINRCPTSYNLLDKEKSSVDGPHRDIADLYQITLAVVNFSQAPGDFEPGSIFIPETCLAIPIECREKMEKAMTGWDVVIQIIETREPVVFQLQAKGTRQFRVVHRERLKEHGMQLVSLYL